LTTTKKYGIIITENKERKLKIVKCEKCFYWFDEMIAGETIPFCHCPENEPCPPCEEKD
jgi:hypothetical protein